MNAQDQRESELIRYNFTRGFEYEEIAMLMFREHSVRMSLRTLMRRLSILGLRRRHRQYDVDLVRVLTRPGVIVQYGTNSKCKVFQSQGI